MKLLNTILFLSGLTLLMAACDDDNDPEVTTPLEVKTISDIPANPQPPGPPSAAPPDFTFLSLEDGSIIPDADSATTRWDIGLNGTTIIVNGGISGPGSTEARILTGLFDEITTAPETGYAVDSESGFAIPTGSGNGWYNYNLNGNNIVSPIPGKVIVVKTSAGNYSKFEILNYYQGNPDITSEEFISNPSPGRYYTIKYVYQPDGSRNF